MIVKKHLLANKQPFYDCTVSAGVRLAKFKNCDFISVYPCCVYQFKHIDKPLGIINFNELKNIDLFSRLEQFRKVGQSYNDIYTNCVNYHDTEANCCNYYCPWREFNLKTIDVSILESCNLNCTMCEYDHRKNDEMADYYFYILNAIKNHQLNKIYLTQVGEPFFYKRQTMEYLQRLTPNDTKEVIIVTNASLLTDADIELLAEIHKTVKMRFVISFDGITKTTYETQRVYSNYEKVMHNAIKLNEYRMLIGINYVVNDLTKSELITAYNYWMTLNPYIVFAGLPDAHYYDRMYNTPEFQELLRLQSAKKPC